MNLTTEAPSAATLAVSVRGVSRVYAQKRGSQEIRALDDVSLELERGEFLALLGPNGSGKSSLLRMIATLDVPTSGEVLVLGESVGGAPRAIRAKIGVLFQHASIDPLLTIRENLRTSAALYGLRGRDAMDRVTECAEELGIADRLDDRAGSLSGGLLRRTDLARALLHDPELLVLDEPTTGLDPTARASFMDAIERRRARRPMGVVMSTHLLDEAERAGRVAMLSRGRLVANGTADELRGAIGAAVLVRTDAASAHFLDEFGTDVQLRSGCATIATDAEKANAIAARLIEQGVRVSVGPPTLDDVYEHFSGAALAEEVAS